MEGIIKKRIKIPIRQAIERVKKAKSSVDSSKIKEVLNDTRDEHTTKNDFKPTEYHGAILDHNTTNAIGINLLKWLWYHNFSVKKFINFFVGKTYY